MTTTTRTTTPLAKALHIAAELTASNLNPAYATPLAHQLAHAAITGCAREELHNAADQIDALADAVGLHGIGDDPDLTANLTAWATQLRSAHSEDPACPTCHQQWGLLGDSGQCLNCGTGIVGATVTAPRHQHLTDTLPGPSSQEHTALVAYELATVAFPDTIDRLTIDADRYRAGALARGRLASRCDAAAGPNARGPRRPTHSHPACAYRIPGPPADHPRRHRRCAPAGG